MYQEAMTGRIVINPTADVREIKVAAIIGLPDQE